MPRLFLPDTHLSPGVITITGEKARYLSTVLRCKTGDHLTVKDGRGKSFSSRILQTGSRDVTVEIGDAQVLGTESVLQIILVQGMLKGEKMDLVVQKATELGVAAILPVVTERCQVRTTRKIDRWRKIAEEAARQSGRDLVPLLHEPVTLTDFLRTAEPPGIIFWEEEGGGLTEAVSALPTSDSDAAPGCIQVVVGPEGGFSAEEVRHAAERGFVVASLGKRTLRAETASIAALAILQYVVGDMGN